MSNPYQDESVTPEERMARSHNRKRRRVYLPTTGTLGLIETLLKDSSCQDMQKCLFDKLLQNGIIDDQTNPEVVHWINANAATLVVTIKTCIAKKESNGMECIKAIFSSHLEDTFVAVSTVCKTTYSSIAKSNDKYMFWCICATFLVVYFEFSTDDIYSFPAIYTEDDLKQFLRAYPEFLCRTWDVPDLFQFQICMRLALRAFGCKSNMVSLFVVNIINVCINLLFLVNTAVSICMY
jgi:hypothetical protein